jgi:predicted ATPase/DNA-binding SARP family transcriptional activator
LSQLKITLLGAPQIEIDHAPIEVDTRKAVALLAYLAVTGVVQSRDSLAALLWPDSDQSSARAALRRTLSVLRKAVGADKLDVSRESIGISAAADVWCDVDQFHRDLERLGTHGHPASEVCQDCLPILEQAVELVHDHFMAGFSLRDSLEFDNWQFYQAESLRKELAESLEKLSLVYAQQGDYQSALKYARRWSAAEPLLEEAHRLLIKLYAWSDQRNLALHQYQECVRILDQELGVQPLDETTQLYQAVLENRPPAEPVQKPSLQAGQSSPQGASSGSLGSVPPLVGRAAEWKALQQAYEAPSEQGHFVVLEGELGIGKTSLAEEFLDVLCSQGAPILQARCYEGERGLAYGPFISALGDYLAQPGAIERLRLISPHALSEVSRLLPELRDSFPDISAPLSLDRPGAQSRFLEGLRQVLVELLAGTPRGVMFLDDLHWADEASLGLITYLLRRLGSTRLFILVTWRSDSPAASSELSQLTAGAQRIGLVTRIPLYRLNQAALDELMDGMLPADQALSQGFRQRFYHETEGVPFIAVEYLGLMRQDVALNTSDDWKLPASVRDVLLTRLASVDETASQLLGTAAVIGRSFDFDTLRLASGRSEWEALNGLEALLAAGLIEERGTKESLADANYDFSHEKLRELVYEQTSRARRRLLHRRVAQAFLRRTRARSDPGVFASQIAHHFHLAGEFDRSAEFYRLAGDYARSLFANVEAVAHYKAALAAGHPEACGLYEALGDLYTLLGEYLNAIHHYEEARKICSPVSRPRLEHKLGEVYARQGEWIAAEKHFQSALDGYGSPEDLTERASLFVSWCRVALQRGQIQQANDLARQALQAAEKSRDRHALAQAHNISGMLARSQEDLEAALHHLQHSLQIAEDLDDQPARVAALNNLALVFGERGEFAQAIQLLETALDLCSRLGDRHRQAALHNNLADLLHMQGKTEAAMQHLKQAVKIFAEIEDSQESLTPEIWKLTEW